MSLPLPFRTFFLLNVLSALFFPNPTLQTALVTPISKDKSTNLFTLSVFLKTPLRPTKLYLDLGFLFPWTVCDANYNSSSFREITCDPAFCATLGFGGLSCNNCTDFNPPNPNCVPANLVCGSFPENPVTIRATSDVVLIDTLALPTTPGPGPGPFVLLPNYTFSCAHSTLLKGLPKNVMGLAALGRSNLSFQGQISAALSSPRCFALCFPASSKTPGVAFFGSTGPYYVFSSPSSKIDLSKSLIYTPLILNPVGVGDTVITYGGNPPSNQHFIGLTSIKINGNNVPINASLLTINQDDGFGGTKISTATPYTVLESSIHKAFTELFVKEASSPAFNLTVTVPAKPFNVCYPAGDLTVTRVGPLVPTVDLVLHAHDVFWRISGGNSMVRVRNKRKGVDLWCLGFVDGGVNKKTPIVIGGKQLEDNLVQFDLESNRLGFTSSLLSRSLSCADFNVTDFADNGK
ncbi:probable aspartic proteinase GIP1 [Gastrolobium bilobum]|uniref:probable aspartic proteinase GIP1 n=1 Tax=Gastrolobium bilobum TaxID=150636 RepID=UPI002AB19FD5|nr:probable aspartic proteinase GIP1 [Gastrolobium bilobum]